VVRQGDRASRQVLPCPITLQWAVRISEGCDAPRTGYLM
jgi:hypothetical protein